VDEKDVAISETNQGKNRSTCDVMLAGTRWCRDRATYSVVPYNAAKFAFTWLKKGLVQRNMISA
jgi:hypothetical protein